MISRQKHIFQRILISIILIISIFSIKLISPGKNKSPLQTSGLSLLKLLGIEASPESIDYVQNKTPFQLHNLLTEQRHPKTWNLSEKIKKDTTEGLQDLLAVDEDIVKRLDALAADTQTLDQASSEIAAALLAKRQIYIYGCGATGRLAKQMESSFWRPFWRTVKANEKIWFKIKPYVGESVENELIGEMTGADRALISSLEGFEDLQLIGRLQLQDRGIRKGDVVIGVTEGGETSSVIGTILTALDQWKEDKEYSPEESRKNLYFVYNNPDDRLLPFVRSRTILEEPGITKINLTTGPQAITGSTRMQAATIETFVIGSILETALERMLEQLLSKKEMARIGFDRRLTLAERLREFRSVHEEVKKNIPAIARFTEIEAQTYMLEHFSTYFAQKGLITFFIDSTERSPTFRLYPLDTVKEQKRRCWIQVWTSASNIREAWLAFLGRPFRGLSKDLYEKPFQDEIEDPYLKAAALQSLERAGDDQQDLYDFSLSELNLKKRGPKKDDLGVAVLIAAEEEDLGKPDSAFRKFISLFSENGAKVILIVISDQSAKKISTLIRELPASAIYLQIQRENDPLGLKQQVGLKMLLNAHSTAVMTRLGRVIGNTMTNVSPSNLKLIGRATYLIQSHVNDVLQRPEWVRLHSTREPISYGEANAVLFDSIAFLRDRARESGQTAEVALSIIRILESLRLKRGLTAEEALNIVQSQGLSSYLSSLTLALK